jgi:hypothetical protein
MALRYRVRPESTARVTSSRVEQAARNNALWCETVCRIHGTPGRFGESIWLNQHPVPRFYPNVVTLSSRDVASQFSAIQDLVASGLGGGWSVKDSFSMLDLAALRFRVLFEAIWLWRAPSAPPVHRLPVRLRWTIVRDARELANWERAWSGNPAPRAFSLQPRLFLPALLDDPAVVFIAAYHEEKIVGGAIANRTREVLGLSNVFAAPEEDPLAFWSLCVAMAERTFPEVPIVAYAHGPTLPIARDIGFELLQPMKVWTRQP